MNAFHTLSFAGLLASSVAAEANTLIADGRICTLPEAITAANTDTAVGGCPAGRGADLIKLMANVTLVTVNNETDEGPQGLPSVTSPITLNGQGHTIARSRAKDTPAFGIMHIGEEGELTIDGVTIQNGVAHSGGGICNILGRVTILNSHISDNVAADGGAVFNRGGTISVDKSTLSGNRAEDSGGAVFNRGGTISVDKSILSGNRAEDSGGGFFNRRGVLAVSNSTISNNNAYMGGGFYTEGQVGVESDIRITNSNVSGNSAHGGGGFLLSSPGTATLVNVTIVNNIAYKTVGGLWSSGGVSVSLQDTIIANSFNFCIFCAHEDKTDCYLSDASVEDLGGNRIENDVNC